MPSLYQTVQSLAAQVTDLQARMEDAYMRGVPVGAVSFFAGSTPPIGWLALDGSIVERAVTPQLWSYAQAQGMVVSEDIWQQTAITQTSVAQFSSGNGATTFRLPKVVDFLRGANSTAGRGPGIWNSDDIKTHAHLTPIQGTSSTEQYAFGGQLRTVGRGLLTWSYSQQGDAARTIPETSDTGGSETIPKTVNYLLCIKAYSSVVAPATLDMAALSSSVFGKVDKSAFALDMAALSSSVSGKVDKSAFAQTLAATGMQKFPSGLVLQWGETPSIALDASVVITFPAPFPTACAQVLATATNPASGAMSPQFSTRLLTQANFTITNDSTAGTARWLAVGY